MSSCFNPHPARELDATWPGEDFAIVEHRFNPHPARELDATRCAPCQRIPQIVSTLIQPESWMLRVEAHLVNPAWEVSTLIQPESWMLHCSCCHPCTSYCCFNPHPARELDATIIRVYQTLALWEFQPSSSPRAGCYSKPPSMR